MLPKTLHSTLRHLYGAGILFFYYFKWPIALGLPVLYFYLDYKRNPILDILWVWSVGLILKDFIMIYMRYRRGEKLWR